MQKQSWRPQPFVYRSTWARQQICISPILYRHAKNVSLTPVYTWMTRDAADLPWRHPSFDVAPAPRLLTAMRWDGVVSLYWSNLNLIAFQLGSESGRSRAWKRLGLTPQAREDPCQTLAKSLTDAGWGVFDMKGLVWYGGERSTARGGGAKICPVMNRQWVSVYL